MTVLDTLRDTLRHMEWADAEVWRVVRRSTAAPADPFVTSRLHHIHEVQSVYLDLWKGETPAPPALESFIGIAAIEAWARLIHARIVAHVSQLDARMLDRLLAVPWAAMLEERLGRPPEEITVAGSMLQVAIHSSHHRGQLCMRLRELGCEPPLVDFITWVWAGRPAPVWTEPEPRPVA
jgi:uncharacterized damage-inducible protein DinB